MGAGAGGCVMTWRDSRRVRHFLIGVLVLVSACGLNSRGPWITGDGRQLQGSEVIEYDGFAACDQQRVVFLFFFGDTYAKDDLGRLGPLASEVDGRLLTFEVGPDLLPESAFATGINHAGREIFIADDRADYLYIRLANGMVERWPRAEVSCIQQ
jgi:hypothetical protein